MQYVSPYLEAWKIKTETVLLVDAVLLFHDAIDDLTRTTKIESKPLSCKTKDNWKNGDSIINFMKTVIKRQKRNKNVNWFISREALKDYLDW